MNNFRARPVLRFVFIAALTVCSGCASVTQQKDPRPGTAYFDGKYTFVGDSRMGLNQAKIFYKEHGTTESAALVSDGQRDKVHSNFNWAIFGGIGAGIGATGGVAAGTAYAQQSRSARDSAMADLGLIAGALLGFSAGALIGYCRDAYLEQQSNEKAIRAALLYNANLQASPAPKTGAR